MNKFLRILPFLIVLLVVYGLQVKWDVDNKHLPYTEPFGRESAAGVSTVNRAPQILPDGRLVWLQGDNLLYQQIDPATQQRTEEKRPVPNADIYSQTTFRLAGDAVYWLGKGEQLKTARWTNGAWTGEKVLADKSRALYVAEAGGKRLLFVGTGGQLKVYAAVGDALQEQQSYAFAKPVAIHGQLGAGGRLHIGVVDMTGSEGYELRYLSFDPATGRGGEAALVRRLTLPTGSSIYESQFGIDATHAYYFLTKSAKGGNYSLQVWTMPLAQPGEGRELPLRDRSTQQLNLGPSYLAYPAQGQQATLPFVFVAGTAKNPRVGGDEVFLSALQGGAWTADITQVTNLRKAAQNPVFAQQGSAAAVVFAMQNTYEQYQMYYASSDPAYAAATNRLTQDDYLDGVMSVPRYIGFSFISLFMAIAWPVLSYLYLLYFVVRNEDSLHFKANRHVAVAVVLYYAAQAYMFLNYGKFDNYNTYAPSWMQSNAAILGLLAAMTVFCYLCTVLFGKLRYERAALPEFSYFFALNIWTALLGFSYFLAM